jgi:hypothetical protein
MAVSPDHLLQPLRRHSHFGCPSQGQIRDNSSAPAEGPAITNVGHGHQLASRNMHEAADPIALGREYSGQSTHTGPKAVDHIGPTVGTDRANGSEELSGQARWATSFGRHVYDGGAKQLITARRRFLSERHDGDPVVRRETFYDVEQGRDNAFAPSSINASRNHKHNMHKQQFRRPRYGALLAP